MLSSNGTPVNTIVLRAGSIFPSTPNSLVDPVRGTGLHLSEEAGPANSFPCNPVLPPLYHCKPGIISAEWFKEGGNHSPSLVSKSDEALASRRYPAEQVSGRETQ